MPVPPYSAIPDGALDAESPWTEETTFPLRDNPRAVAGAHATVPPGERIKFPEAMRTDNVDATARAAPDGVGGVRWIGGGFAGVGVDGVGLGSPVAALGAGVYHFEDLTVAAPQTPTGPLEIFCEGDVEITDTIVSSYRIIIRCAGSVTVAAAITCRGLEIRCGGDLGISAAIDAHDGANPTRAANDMDNIGVARFYVGGDLDITATVSADDVLIFCVGSATIPAILRALWNGSGAPADGGSAVPTLDGTGWPTYDGSGRDNGAQSHPTDGAGGGGGTGGGYGGRPDGTPGSRSFGDSLKGGKRLYLVRTDRMRRGGGGGAGGSGSSGAGGRGGGRISLYVAGDLDLDSGTLNASGEDGVSDGSFDSGAGGGGTVRVACAGTLNDGTGNSNGGDGGPADGGGGGGGGLFMVASSYTGAQTNSATGGASSQGENGEGGTVTKDTLTSDEIEALALSGVFDV